MIRFEENKLIIEIKDTDPVEAWAVLHSGLCDIIRYVKQESICDDSFSAVIDFMQELIPEWDTVHQHLVSK